MPAEITVAIITVCGTALSAFFGVIVASRMTNYRICQLEKKVEIHNNAITRIAVLERSCVETEHRVLRIEEDMRG